MNPEPNPDAIADGPAIAAFLDVPRHQLHNWTRAGLLEVQARDDNRRAMYRISDVQQLADNAPGRGTPWRSVVYSDATAVNPAQKADTP